MVPTMNRLSDQEHQAQMDDMRSFDEQMPCVGIFWYDMEDHVLFGVRKKELPARSGGSGREREALY